MNSARRFYGGEIMRVKRITQISLLLFVLAVFLSPQTAQAATYYTVINTADSGVGSLRWAISNANSNTGEDVIEFNIGGCIGPCSIHLLSPLPFLTDGGTTINGYSLPGTAEATASSAAVIGVQLDGSGLANPFFPGLGITASDCVIKGLAIVNFPGNGIAIAKVNSTDTASNNTIAGNYIGTNFSGNVAAGNGGAGVFIGLGATNNLIGGDQPADRNVISANEYEGVSIHGENTSTNTVSGNYFGTNYAGTAALPNEWQGVRIYGGANDNTIGGATVGERNLISGNFKEGVLIAGSGTDNNTVSGNYIGTQIDGHSSLPNALGGVKIKDGPQNNTIGGSNTNPGSSCAGDCNLISRNTGSGVSIFDSDTADNTVSGNFIGTDYTGTEGAGNTGTGVVIGAGATNNLIGGSTAGANNLISGNGASGVYIFAFTLTEIADNAAVPNTVTATSNTIMGNFIGTNLTGSTAIPNAWYGIWISGEAADNTVMYNLISGNLRHGVYLSFTSGNTVSGNMIGMPVGGNAVLKNWDDGIHLGNLAENNQIGGSAPTERNYISGNGERGITIEGAETTGNVISGNYIGTNVSGTLDVGNEQDGITLENGAHENTIGGTDSGDGNLIGFNDGYGISLLDNDVTGNTIAGNMIGTDSNGDLNLGNGFSGIQSLGTDNTIGPNNIIAYNFAWGVYVSGGVGTVITQNSIFSNGSRGISLEPGANNDIPAPVIVSVTAWPNLAVLGSACGGCTVEIFANSVNDDEGEIYLGSGVATAGGAFNISISSIPYAYLTATATDATDSTSEFSAVFTTTVVLTVYLPIVAR
jgi:parallel beta-helix repeat protein